MPRPKLQSDEAVLDLAHAALIERGAGRFSLTDVAERTGLSKATILQRFGSKQILLTRIAERQVELTRAYLDGLPLESGFAGLRAFLRDIVGSMGPGTDFAGHLDLALLEAEDPALRALADQRYRLVQAAIARRLPPLTLSAETVAAHLHAVIAGASMQWVVSGQPDLAAFVFARLEPALDLLERAAA